MPRLIGLEDQRGPVAMFGEMAVEAIDREVELAVRVPADVEIVLVVRPVAGLRRELVPGQPPSLIEPEAVGIGIFQVVQSGKLARADPRLEALGNRMDRFVHKPLLISMTKR